MPENSDKLAQDSCSEPRIRVPAPIRQLPEDVVNRIAAGEVIQRPANAIKELLENSLDAGSTQIQVTVRDGGLKLLQVQDNGCGIRQADLAILCERFTTSKLKEFSDLNGLLTFGFRGEALASLSHVSLLTVTTRTADEICAYRLSYRDGKPTAEVATACAANPGTTILAEDLFYNTPLRKQALRNARDEFARVAEVVSQYAIHYAPKCGFHLRSLNTGSVTGAGDLRTSAGWSRMDAIRVVIGPAIAANLITLDSCQPGTSETTSLAIERLGLRFEGLLTNPSQITSGASPSLKLNLFINNRMVECAQIKRALESSYSTVLSRGLNPAAPVTSVKRVSGRTSISSGNSLFVYLNLQLPPESLDVNVHPTKAEVHFLHEDEIIAGLQDAVEHSLLSCAQVRSFLTKPLPLSELGNLPASQNSPELRANKPQTNYERSPQSFRPQEKVRIDSREQRLDRFMTSRYGSPISAVRRSTSSQVSLGFHSSRCDISGESTIESSSTDPTHSKSNHLSSTREFAAPENVSYSPVTEAKIGHGLPADAKEQHSPNLLNDSSTIVPSITPVQRRTVRLASVLSMQQAIFDQADESTRRFLRSCKMIGPIDRTRCLLQYSTDLLLVRLEPLSRELFYQLLVMNFANHGEMILSEPAPLKQLLELGRQSCSNTTASAIQDGVNRLMRNAPMLWDYFSVKLELGQQTGEPELTVLPLLLDKYTPDLDRLPELVVRLASEVNWDTEAECLQAVCRLLSEFYSVRPPLVHPRLTGESADHRGDNVECTERWVTEHVLWPALTSFFAPPRGLLDDTLSESKDGAFFRLARLSDLYKVFERC